MTIINTLSIVDFASFIWDVIKNLIDGIMSVINFIYNLVALIPEFLTFLPNEISILIGSAVTIVVVIFIFKFIK